MMSETPVKNSSPNPASEIIFAPSPIVPGGFRLRTQLWLPQSREELFTFFGDAGQLETITPPWLNFKVLTELPIEMQPGAIIDYQLRLHGIPIHWKTEITAWEPPYQFVDEQISGPYRVWKHLHTFEESNSGTLMTDQVDYAMIGSKLIHWLIVKRDLRKIFAYRHDALLEIFC